MFGRIVVGTDGSETAAEAVRQATELAKLSGAQLDIVSAFEPIPQQRVKSEAREAPGDVQYEISPREDVNLILDGASGEAKKAGIEEVQAHAREGEPADAILDVAEAGMSPDQVSRAVRQAVERGLATRSQLRERGRERGRRVESLVSGALEALPS